MKTYNATVYIEQDEDGVFVWSIPWIKSCYAQWSTQSEMMTNLLEVTKLCLRNDNKEIEKSKFIWIQNLDISYA